MTMKREPKKGGNSKQKHKHWLYPDIAHTEAQQQGHAKIDGDVNEIVRYLRKQPQRRY